MSRDNLIKLTNVRISYANLFEKVSYKDNKPKYTAHFVMKKDSDAAKLIEETINRKAKEAWGDKAEKTLKGIRGNNMKYVFQDGELKDYGDDTMYLSTSSQKQPSVFHAHGKRATEEDNPIYSGCYVNALVTIFTTKQGGIAAQVCGVQFVEDGEAFGGGYVATADDFGFEESFDDKFEE